MRSRIMIRMSIIKAMSKGKIITMTTEGVMEEEDSMTAEGTFRELDTGRRGMAGNGQLGWFSFRFALVYCCLLQAWWWHGCIQLT